MDIFISFQLFLRQSITSLPLSMIISMSFYSKRKYNENFLKKKSPPEFADVHQKAKRKIIQIGGMSADTLHHLSYTPPIFFSYCNKHNFLDRRKLLENRKYPPRHIFFRSTLIFIFFSSATKKKNSSIKYVRDKPMFHSLSIHGSTENLGGWEKRWKKASPKINKYYHLSSIKRRFSPCKKSCQKTAFGAKCERREMEKA